MQLEASARLEALHALLDAALRPSKSEAVQVSALQFVGDQVAAMVQSSALDSEQQQTQLQSLINTSMVRLKVTSTPLLTA